MDIVVIEQEDGSYVTSPFHVRFGKLKLLKPTEKEVKISVNGEETDLTMQMGRSGEGNFLVFIISLLRLLIFMVFSNVFYQLEQVF